MNSSTTVQSSSEPQPDWPIHRVGYPVLNRLLSKMLTLLQKTARSDQPTVETIHQLRVSTRRAQAGLKVFKTCIKETHYKKIVRQLRQIRRAANQTRDCDVHAALLRKHSQQSPDKLKPILQLLSHQATQQRKAALQNLHRAVNRHVLPKLPKTIQKLLQSLHEASEVSLRSPRMIRSSLSYSKDTLLNLANSTLTKQLVEAQQTSNENLEQPETLHTLRVKVKNLRYAMEIFTGCFGPTFHHLYYKRIEEIQSRLGEINDDHQILARLNRFLTELYQSFDSLAYPTTLSVMTVKSETIQLMEYFRERVTKRTQEFLSWWSEEQMKTFLEDLARFIQTNPQPQNKSLCEKTPHSFQAGSFISANPFDEGSPSGGVPHPLRMAAIDVGTNSIRLIVAELMQDGRYRIIEDDKETTRLGRGLSRTNRLSLETMTRSAQVIARMKKIADHYQARAIRIVATCAVREADNRDVFIEMVYRQAGVEIEVISAEAEARLAFSSAAQAFHIEAVPTVVADIGGGSTELIFSSNGMIEHICTLPLGAIRLAEQYPGCNENDAVAYEKLRDGIGNILNENLRPYSFKPLLLIGTGGTFTSLAKILLWRGMPSNKTDRFPFDIRGYQIKLNEARQLVDLLKKTPLSERKRILGLSASRAEIIVGGAAIIIALLEKLSLDSFDVHDGGIRDGLLIEMMDQMRRHHNMPPLSLPTSDKIHHAMEFARQCGYPESHSNHVTALALQIFDQLHPAVHQHPDSISSERLLLATAAILHDIGHRVDTKNHHKHSYRLIVSHGLPGFSRREIEMIAQIARYHRRALPKLKHAAYVKLNNEDQRLVSRLAAILRIADGLDYSQNQNIQSVKVLLKPKSAHFFVHSKKDPTTTLVRTNRKSKLFKKVFQKNPKIMWEKNPFPKKIGNRKHIIDRTQITDRNLQPDETNAPLLSPDNN